MSFLCRASKIEAGLKTGICHRSALINTLMTRNVSEKGVASSPKYAPSLGVDNSDGNRWTEQELFLAGNQDKAMIVRISMPDLFGVGGQYNGKASTGYWSTPIKGLMAPGVSLIALCFGLDSDTARSGFVDDIA
ncbi:hypothetical protein RRG08_049449 [Elysia crispata]|uniref:Uncharacterized protein n=1 Tax=Elysia crispata TaxID=231223 RepID=A0AAE0ZSJ0_9GAST|nr:hypothetical protein RRG08_049449 [Elysia crispata]